ncbi:MAG: DUF134 domain-containing protein [Syntrophobacteraceae bacterium]
MSRPKCCRRISGKPACSVFMPIGVTVQPVEEILLSIDEFEAIRLADLEGLYQESGAERMSVSRQTFGRILESARRKVATAIVSGYTLRIAEERDWTGPLRVLECLRCACVWKSSAGEGCPRCSSPGFECLGEKLHQGLA